MDMDKLASDHPAKRLRSGDATLTDSCEKIRAVPSALRDSNVMYSPINTFYTQYTEAYGIPIIGMQRVFLQFKIVFGNYFV